jgi:hypothetical protein
MPKCVVYHSFLFGWMLKENGRFDSSQKDPESGAEEMEYPDEPRNRLAGLARSLTPLSTSTPKIP